MKKTITLFYLLIAFNFIYGGEQNSFYENGELNIYAYSENSSINSIPPPPPPTDVGGGSTTPGGPTVIIQMYLPLLFGIAVFLIYKNRNKI